MLDSVLNIKQKKFVSQGEEFRPSLSWMFRTSYPGGTGGILRSYVQGVLSYLRRAMLGTDTGDGRQ